MPSHLSTYARQFLTDEELARRSHTVPVLVWEAPQEGQVDPLLLGTSTGAPSTRPRSGEPLVFEVKKGPSKQNAFTMGITIGRTENNDIILDDNSISRFHAYLQQDARTQEWRLVDAESKNGTWVGPLRLVPRQGEVVGDNVRVKFGDIDLIFLLPQAFFAYLQKLIGP